MKEIKELFENREYEHVLKRVNQKLDKSLFDFNKPEEYETYKELLSYRVACNIILNKQDDAVNSIARKQKYYYKSIIEFDEKNKVTFIEKDIFFIKTDAYINSIPKNKKFNTEEKSFSYSLQSRMGINKLEKQLNNQLTNESNNYIVLEHSFLSAPKSYHILSIDDNNSIDKEKLKEGLEKLMLQFMKERPKSFSFIPLGSEAKVKNSEEKFEIIEIVADAIEKFFREKPKNYNPDILFSFVNYQTLKDYEKKFNDKTDLGKYLGINRKEDEFDKFYKKVINAAKTKNNNYIESLKSLSFFLKTQSTHQKNKIILLLGETGVGKSYFAENVIHNSDSERKKRGYVSVNCANSHNDNLLMSKIFGSVKGAHNDAVDSPGAIGNANGGTLFLDEIGDAGIETQNTLLTFFDTGKYDKLGESGTKNKADCRIVLGTNKDLEQLVYEGKMKKDFYERISNDKTLIIPPLRERIEDIETLIPAILENLNKDSKLNISITDEALKKIKEFKWPGNVRQLSKMIENWHEYVIYSKKTQIDIEVIKNNLPRDCFLEKNIHSILIDNLEKSFLEWDYNKDGNYLDNFILPALSSIYSKTDLTKQNCKKILGIYGGSGKSSPYDKHLEKFNSEKFEEILKKKK